MYIMYALQCCKSRTLTGVPFSRTPNPTGNQKLRSRMVSDQVPYSDRGPVLSDQTPPPSPKCIFRIRSSARSRSFDKRIVRASLNVRVHGSLEVRTPNMPRDRARNSASRSRGKRSATARSKSSPRRAFSSMFRLGTRSKTWRLLAGPSASGRPPLACTRPGSRSVAPAPGMRRS